MARNSQAVVKRASEEQQQVRPAQPAAQRQIEEYEAHASASAQAGLNLNIFAAFSGIFSSKSKRTKDTAADGSSHEVEDRDEVGYVKGAGHGNMQAVGSAKADSGERYSKRVEEAKGVKAVKGLEQAAQVDHLGLGERGIEGYPKPAQKQIKN